MEVGNVQVSPQKIQESNSVKKEPLTAIPEEKVGSDNEEDTLAVNNHDTKNIACTSKVSFDPEVEVKGIEKDENKAVVGSNSQNQTNLLVKPKIPHVPMALFLVSNGLLFVFSLYQVGMVGGG